MPSRNPDDLCIAIRPKYDAFMTECHKRGIDVFNTCTYRTNWEQAELFAIGRTKPGKIGTWANVGESKHNMVLNGKPAAQAFDVAILRYGKLVWDKTKEDVLLWQIVGVIGEDCGLKWAGRWKKPKREFPHFEI